MLKGQRKTMFALVGCITFLGIPWQSTTNLVTSSCCCLVAQLCLTLCDPMDCSMPGFPVLHYLLESMMPSNRLILCCPLLLLPSIFPSIRVFSNELSLHIRQPKYWSFSFSISPSNEYSGLISFRIDQFDLFAVQRTERELSGLKQQKCFISQLWRLEGQIKTLEGLCSVLSLLGRILPCLF